MFNYEEKKTAGVEYSKALANLKLELNKLSEEYPGKTELYDAIKQIMTIADANKNHKIISDVNETKEMTEVLKAVTSCLNDPSAVYTDRTMINFISADSVDTAVFDRACELAAKLPDKAPITWPYRAALGVIAVGITLAIIGIAVGALVPSFGAAAPLSAGLIVGAGVGLGNALSGLGFAAAGAGLTTFFTGMLPTFLAAPLAAVGGPSLVGGGSLSSGLLIGTIDSAMIGLATASVAGAGYLGFKGAQQAMTSSERIVHKPSEIFKQKFEEMKDDVKTNSVTHSMRH